MAPSTASRRRLLTVKERVLTFTRGDGTAEGAQGETVTPQRPTFVSSSSSTGSTVGRQNT